MIIAFLNEKWTSDITLKNIEFELNILKTGYDYEDCCCGDACSCNAGHNSIELIDKMSTINEFDSTISKNGYDYEDCCCGDACSCGQGHNRIELIDKMTTLELEKKNLNILTQTSILDYNELELNTRENTASVTHDGIRIHEIDNIVVENLILDQSDMNIPLIALRLAVILLIGLTIEAFNAWEGISIKNKSKFFVWKKDNNKSGPKFLDAPVSWGLYFQDAASPSFEGVVDLHNRIMFYLVVILFGVSWVLASLMTNYNNLSNKLVYRHLNHGKYVPIQKYSKLKKLRSLRIRIT
jgi:Cytochrome C oxidase subunit II, transmembrane domain